MAMTHPAPQAAGHDHQEAGDTTLFGFWIYLMSDCLLFGCLFATYAVLQGNTAGGPSAAELFELPFVLGETLLLLASSFTFGLGVLAMHRDDRRGLNLWLVITFLLGAAFIGMELYEFHHLIAAGADPQRSAFLSAFFTLVGTHGLHVGLGLVWLLVLLIQVNTQGLTAMTRPRVLCLSLFWHFLDVVWICVFSIVYLLGVMS